MRILRYHHPQNFHLAGRSVWLRLRKSRKNAAVKRRVLPDHPLFVQVLEPCRARNSSFCLNFYLCRNIARNRLVRPQPFADYDDALSAAHPLSGWWQAAADRRWLLLAG